VEILRGLDLDHDVPLLEPEKLADILSGMKIKATPSGSALIAKDSI
jgi:hypothetical protein